LRLIPRSSSPRRENPEAEGPKAVIIDTDIGDDVDDALALALALRSPELDLRAVTTVFGNVEVRTRLALKVLKTFGREDIPVATGIGRPLLERTFLADAGQRTPNQATVLAEGERLPRPSPRHAVDLIISTAMAAGDGVTLIPVGALTNVASALLREPRLAERARVVLMGGVVSRPRAEHNVRCDPEAARIVFESGIPITMVGLDVTLRCVLGREDVERLRGRGLATTSLLADMIAAWRRGSDRLPVLHDPLAVAVSFNPGLVTTRPMAVRVETRGEFTRGFTVAHEGGEPNAQVCVDVDAGRFLRLFMDRVMKNED